MCSGKRLIKAVFVPVLDHGDVIYKHPSASTLKPLDSVQHLALSFITGDGYHTHHSAVYNKVGWSPLSKRCKKRWYLFICEAVRKIALDITQLEPRPLSSPDDGLCCKFHIGSTYSKKKEVSPHSCTASTWNKHQHTLRFDRIMDNLKL